MNAVKGTYRLIYEEMRWILVIFWSITLSIAAIYLTLGLLFDIGFPTTLFGPIYGGICTIGAVGITTIFPIAVGLGSTRTQFMKSYYVVSSIMVIGFITFLNMIYFILDVFRQHDLHTFTFFHPGNLFSNEYHALSYLWIDLMIGFLFLGLTSFITVSWRKLGTRNFLIIFFSINILATLFVTATNLLSEIGPVIFENAFYSFTGCGVIGGLLLVATYPIMKHTPLTLKPVHS